MGWEANVFPILIAGNTVIINGQGMFIYGGAPALNNLLYSNSPVEAKDSVGNWYFSGETSYGPDLFTDVGFIAQNESAGVTTWYFATTMGGTSPPWAVEAIMDWQDDGFLIQEQSGAGIELEALNGGDITLVGTSLIGENAASGLTGFMPTEQTDTSDNPNNNAGTVGMTAQFTIPPGDAKVGTAYVIEVPFNGVFQASGLAFKPALNTASVVTSLGDGVAAALLGAGVGFTGWVRLIMRVKTLGAGGTVDYFIEGGLGQNAQHTSANQAILSSQSTGMPFDTTSSNTLRINSVWTAAVAGQAVTGHGSVFTRKGP